MTDKFSYLRIECFFRLPDDFQGSPADALRLLADYWDEQDAQGNPTREVISDKVYPTKDRIDVWERFMKEMIMADSLKHKFTGHSSVVTYVLNHEKICWELFRLINR